MKRTSSVAQPLEHVMSGAPLVSAQESAARYAFAAARVRNLRVLDAACGSGLGSNFLATRAAQCVTGVECSRRALADARATPASPSVRFVRADAQVLPFRDASFDAVVSFETIEHLQDARGFLAECRRVLRGGGCLLLSTPNRTVTRWLPPNPFHLREFTQGEVLRMVSEHFSHVQCFWQRPVSFPVFLLRQTGRQCLTALPGGRWLWKLWEAVRPRRTKRGATSWRERCFDEALLADRFYAVVPAHTGRFRSPTYTVVVATC